MNQRYLEGVNPTKTIERSTWTGVKYILSVSAWLVCMGMFGGVVGYGLIMWIGIVIWLTGGVTAFIIREQEMATAKRTRMAIFNWSIALIVYRMFIHKFVNITPQDWANALAINVPVPLSSNAISWTSILMVVMLVSFPVQYGWWTIQLYANHQGRRLVHERYAEIQRNWHQH